MHNKYGLIIALLISLLYACGSGDTSSATKETPVSQSGFTKKVEVFSLNIYATATVTDVKLLHTANVLAEYLDNDEDGKPDDPKVLAVLQAENMAICMTGTYAEFSEMDRSSLPPGAAQDLYDDETHPGGAAKGVFDGALEEVLHPITSIGWAGAYPEAFGLNPGSKIAQAVDKARGGYFADVPESYPDGAWFTYDDETCKYDCMIVEYTYWALTSMLGGQDFPGRLENIQQEWPLNTLEKVIQRDPDVYALLTDPQYNIPTTLPDGDYKAAVFTIEKYSGVKN